MALVSNLYPPIVPDTTIVFNGSCKIYFSLSAYNSKDDIENVQISLVNLRTNASGFNDEIVQYSSGIKIVNFNKDGANKNGLYSVTISASDISNGSFEKNQFYKVQLRFTHKGSGSINNYKSAAAWLYANRNFFSEWSKVVLIKQTSVPKILLRSFSEDQGFSNGIMLTQPIVNIVGKMEFENEKETDILKSYNIKLYEKGSNTILYQTDELYPEPYGSNEINYELIYDFQDAVKYTFKLTYTTLDGYVDSISKDFYIIQTSGMIDRVPADINIFQDSDNGRIKIQIISNSEDNFLGNLVIRRTSSQSNFHKWEDVRIITYAELNKINITWYDKTIKSGIWYKYGIQKENAKGFRGAFTQTQQPVMCLFDDIFLTRKNCQLKINLNPSLNEFKYNVVESQQNPIGSKFPFIKRNSANFFRTFPIGGLISSFMDTQDWYDPHFYIQTDEEGKEKGSFHNNENQLKLFTSKDKIYQNSKNLYKDYNHNNNINEYQDYIYEREFRQKVYDFLYSNNVKLFRSTTQGNILIKLMNIDFQPIESLGRRLYSFTATAVQIDEPTILNFDKYGIQTIGKSSPYINFDYDILGQLDGIFDQNNNILSIIESKQKNSHQKEGYIDEIQKLKWLRIEITSPPYVIVKDPSDSNKLKKADSNTQQGMVGYIVNINDKQIIIFPSIERRNNKNDQTFIDNIYIQHIGYYELKGDNIAITNLSFPYSTEVRIDYIANFIQYEDTKSQVGSTYYDYKAGQVYDLFYPTNSVFRKISNKYLLNYDDYYQRLINISGIAMSAPPKTIAYVRDSNDITFNRHVLENGFLQLMDEEASINGLYFCGIHLEQCTDPLQSQIINGLTEFHMVTNTNPEESWTSIFDINNPENGGIYQIEKENVEDPAVQSQKYQAHIEDHTILVVESSQTENQDFKYERYSEYTVISQEKIEKIYKLLLDRYRDKYKMYFVYYYGCWYLLPAITAEEAAAGTTAEQILEPFTHDIRYLRQDEYILTGQEADTFEEITDPIPNGVYTIAAATDNYNRSTLNGTREYLINTDKDYSDILDAIIRNSNNRCIYYKGQWCHFTKDNDVLYPVEALVDYYCEIEKGVYE